MLINRILKYFLVSTLSLTLLSLYGQEAGKCFNSIDDDLDGLVDCADPDCQPFNDCMEIIVDHTKVVGTTDLLNFPMLVDITDARLRNKSNGGSIENINGFDIQFKTNCTAVLDHQIESYDEVSGRLIAWVRVPVLKAISSTVIQLEFGKSSISTDMSSPTVWNSDYDAVYHLHDDLLDMTSNNNDGTNFGSIDIAGFMADGQEFDGANDYVQTSSEAMKSSNEFTLSTWFKADHANALSMILWQGNGTGNGLGNMQQEMHISFGTYTGVFVNNVLQFFMGDLDTYQGNDDVIQIETPFSDFSAWHHVAVVVKDMGTVPSAELFLDGVSVGTDIGTVAKTDRTTWNTPMRIGRPGAAQRYFDGRLDEIHVQTIAQSIEQIQTEYNNQISPSSFYTIGSCSCSAMYCLENCSNGIDDDGDGLIDSDDPECYDCDGDGLINTLDIDDDNDGLLDISEVDCSTVSWHIGWNHTIDNEATIMVPDLIVTGHDESYGSGLIGTIGGSLLQLSGITASTLSESIANQEYVEYSFTTLSSLSEEYFLSEIVQYETAPGNFNGHQLAVFFSNDGFINSTELIRNITTVDGPQYASYSVSEKIYQFEEATTYMLRVYIYNIPPSNSGQATLDDFSLSICSGDFDADDDGVWNHQDLDSDNDGIYDVIEAGGEDIDLDGTIGTGSISDSDGDGWSDISDPDNGGVMLLDPDTNGDGYENRIDLDSDGDGCKDVIESGFPDTDGDGKLGGIAPPTIDNKGLVTSGGL